MLSFQQARDIAENYIKADYSRTDGLIINERYIIIKPYAWIFPYNTRALEGDFSQILIGSSPIFVDNHDGMSNAAAFKMV